MAQSSALGSNEYKHHHHTMHGWQKRVFTALHQTSVTVTDKATQSSRRGLLNLWEGRIWSQPDFNMASVSIFKEIGKRFYRHKEVAQQRASKAHMRLHYTLTRNISTLSSRPGMPLLATTPEDSEGTILYLMATSLPAPR